MATKARYNNRGWVLGLCSRCGRANYVEPHGRTAKCACSAEWTEHESIPFKFNRGIYENVDVSAARKAWKETAR